MRLGTASVGIPMHCTAFARIRHPQACTYQSTASGLVSMSRASHGLGVLLTLWLSASTGGSSTSPCSALYCYESPRTARATDEQERFVASRLHGRGPEYAALASKLVQRCLQVLQDRGDGGAARLGWHRSGPMGWSPSGRTCMLFYFLHIILVTFSFFHFFVVFMVMSPPPTLPALG